MAKIEDSRADSVADTKANAKLEHTRGGVTTRDDATDLGVPMLPGDPKEPIGPEDALGVGPKRGDYSLRIGADNYQPHESIPVEDPGENEPTVKVVAQRERASNQGEQAREKGGVTTTEG